MKSQILPRASMRDQTLIRERMTQDVTTLAAERGGVETWHLAELGWGRAQISAHLPSVVAALKQAA